MENKTAPSPSRLMPDLPMTVPALTSCPFLTDALLRQENAVKYLPCLIKTVLSPLTSPTYTTVPLATLLTAVPLGTAT